MAPRADVAAMQGRDGGAALKISLLGPLEVVRDGSHIEVSGPKRRALFILLALHAGSPVSRERLVEALWTTRQTGREESTLRVHVSHLRDELEPDRDGDPRILVTRGASYMLSEESTDLDISTFDRLTADARRLVDDQPEKALRRLDEALQLWRGRPLQDVEYEEFAQDEIRRLELARVEALENRAAALVGLGEDAAAVESLEALVRDDGARERPVTLLMTALYRTGRQADALRVARKHGRALAEQGLEPSPQLRLLEDRILQHDPALLPEGMVSPGHVTPGRSVRGYELREEAGRGSIGIVYRAFQASVGREVAVKVVDPGLAQAPEFVRRFAEEARVIAGLEHPHIVPLYDFWREPAGAFLVMRWMSGGSLADRSARRWDQGELARIFGQLADALAYAHSAGVVHRDVTPANVLFDGGGNAYLGDFGLAAAGIETGRESNEPPTTLQPPYASPELLTGEGPTVASDVYALGVLLSEAASGGRFGESRPGLDPGIEEAVRVATSTNPADRYPDMAAFRAALQDAAGDIEAPAPRRVRRNPYKGLQSFDEGDRADFYGRDTLIDTLVDAVGKRRLTAVLGASGSGKSSVVMAGLVPTLRNGEIPGSEEWSIVSMVPGTDPFEEFHLALRDAAVGFPTRSFADLSHELREALDAGLDGPACRAVLVVDQFEEVFSSAVEASTRERFLDNLVNLAEDPSRRFRVILTLRADFSDGPLAHPRLGDLISKGSVVVGPMLPEQVEDVIRRPAARVGVQVEPGLISEIVRDVAESPAFLPLLQYVLAELFERRTEDRLTVRAYRSLGGVQGVLERQAEATYASLDESGRAACRQLFLRMVHVGDHGEETRRRAPLTELHGLGARRDVDAALSAFSAARLITYDRDPVSRVPTVEVSHETVISRWTRYKVWVDEARSDVLAHRRLSAAAQPWAESGEDPSYLLTGGPLPAAVALASRERVRLNELETRFLEESQTAAESAAEEERERVQHEADLEQRSRRRLALGIASGLVALVVGVLAFFAWDQSQRANELAATQGRENLSRELAADSLESLVSADHDRSLELAIAAAETTVEAGDDILPEAVEALHRAVVNPRPDLIIEGAMGDTDGEAISYSGDGEALAFVTEDGVVAIVDPQTGTEIWRTEAVESPARGVDFHPLEDRLLSIHRDGVREWDLGQGSMLRHIDHQGTSTANYSGDGGLIATGNALGTITIHDSEGVLATLEGEHEGRITSVDFDPAGTRVVSAGFDGRVFVWEIESGKVVQAPEIQTGFCVYEAVWHPTEDVIAVTLCHGEAFTFNARTGERVQSFESGNQAYTAMAFDFTGAVIAGSGLDGFTHIFGAGVGGASVVDLPSGGAPLEDVEFNPTTPIGEVAALGLNGEIRIWEEPFARAELPGYATTLLFPYIDTTPDGSRYVVASNSYIFGLPQDPETLPPVAHVFDAVSREFLAKQETLFTLGWRTRPAISDNGSMGAVAGPTGNIVVFQIDSAVAEEIPDSARWNLDVDFSSDGKLLAGVGLDGTVAVWELPSRKLLRAMHPGLKALPEGQSLQPNRQMVRVDFRPNSRELLTASADGSVRVWDTDTGSNRIIQIFELGLQSMHISVDGSMVAASDIGGTVRLFDTENGEEIRPIQSVPGQTDVVMSPDGRYLAGGGPFNLVHLWDLESGTIVRRFEGAIGKPTVAFVKGGKELWSASGEGVVRGYTLDPMQLLEIARERLEGEATEDMCQPHLPGACD